MKNKRLIECRKDVPILTKYKILEPGSNVNNCKKEEDYKYMQCDYCEEEIKIENDPQKRTGGVHTIQITKIKSIKIAAHNKCLKPLIKEINEAFGVHI